MRYSTSSIFLLAFFFSFAISNSLEAEKRILFNITREKIGNETIFKLILYKPDNGQYTSQEIFSLDQAI